MSRDDCIRRLDELKIDYKHESYVGGTAHTDTRTYHELRHMVRRAEAGTPHVGRMTMPRTPMGPPSNRLYMTPTPMGEYKSRLEACGVEFKSKFLGTPAYRETVHLSVSLNIYLFI